VTSAADVGVTIVEFFRQVMHLQQILQDFSLLSGR
jgi:hypothetical protein